MSTDDDFKPNATGSKTIGTVSLLVSRVKNRFPKSSASDCRIWLVPTDFKKDSTWQARWKCNKTKKPATELKLDGGQIMNDWK